MAPELNVLDQLRALGIAWTLTDHDAVFTVEDSARLHSEIAGLHTKNLFLKDAAGQHWLVTAPHDASVDLKVLPGVIASKKLSFARAEDMDRLLGVTPGAVTPLAVINDKGAMVRVVLDQRLTGPETVNVHPLRNTATLGMSGADLIRFLGEINHSPLVVALPPRA